MHCSAVFFPIDGLSPFARNIIARNPIYNYILCARKCILHGMLPTQIEWARLIIWSVGSYCIGKFLFHKMQNKVIQKI